MMVIVISLSGPSVTGLHVIYWIELGNRAEKYYIKPSTKSACDRVYNLCYLFLHFALITRKSNKRYR